MSSNSTRNPFKRGKALIISNLFLEGKTIKEVIDHYTNMGFDRKYGVLQNKQIYSIRSELKKAGLLDEGGFLVKQGAKELPESTVTRASSDVEEEEEAPKNQISEENKGDALPITRRPDWDLLTPEMIDRISDPKLRMNILNYKTEIDKLRQELKPEYATRGEIDLLRNDLASRVGGIEEKINTLLSKFDEPESEDESNEEEEPEPEETEVETPKKALRLTSKLNPLEARDEAQEMEDEIIEVEGSIVARKSIGLTAKSMMLYDLAKTQGFPGNLADFVNSCISDAYKGRSIELAVIDKKVIR